MDTLATELMQNAVKHLYKSADILPAPSPENLLKSYYLTKCRTMTLGGPVTLPQRFVKCTVRCPRCCVEYEHGSASFQIKPEYKHNKFVRKLLKKNRDGKNVTRFQEIYLKNLIHKGSVEKHNSLVIHCGVCGRITTENLQKPEEQSVVETAVCSASKSRKKKKKKDKFSGLNKEAVLSATPQDQDKSCSVSNFVPLQVTPIAKTFKKVKVQKKNLFSERNILNTQNNGKISKKKEIKEKQKNLKGLHNVLNNTKQKKSPSVSLRQFLTSI